MKKSSISIAILKTNDENNPWKLSIMVVEGDGNKPWPCSHCAEWDSPATGEKLYTCDVEAVSAFCVAEDDMDAVLAPLVAAILNAKPVKKALETVINQTINNIPWLATGKPRNGK